MAKLKKKAKAPSAEEVRAAALRLFEGIHYTLWPSGGWEITKSDRREKAAGWATDFYLAMHEQIHNKG